MFTTCVGTLGTYKFNEQHKTCTVWQTKSNLVKRLSESLNKIQYNNITRHQCQNVEKLQKKRSGKSFVKEPFKKIKVFREINDAFQTTKLLMTEFYRYFLHVTCS